MSTRKGSCAPLRSLLRPASLSRPGNGMPRVRSFLEHSRILRLFISPPRQQLYRQIDERFDRMVAAGALARGEVTCGR